MKAFGIFLAILLGIGGIIYIVPPFKLEATRLLSYSECDTPLPYKIGAIDPQFGLTSSQVAQDINTSTDIWSNAEGKNLFINSPRATLTVNFTYDERAALNSQINQLQSQLDKTNSSLDQQIAQYKVDQAAFQQRVDAFQATVEKYNKQGGAPPDVYNNLIQQQNELNKEATDLNQRARQLNLSTSQFNNSVSALKGDINQFNNELAKKPEEGLFNGYNNTITIYFADNHNGLLHTLTHEFGHSLGMVHVEDPKAIMYPYTTENLQVTPDDLQQLHYVCREQSLIIHDLQEFDIWLLSEIQALRQNLQVHR